MCATDICPPSWRTKRNAKWVVPNAATAGVTLLSPIQTEPIGKTAKPYELSQVDRLTLETALVLKLKANGQLN
jgi:hypothetical protein